MKAEKQVSKNTIFSLEINMTYTQFTAPREEIRLYSY